MFKFTLLFSLIRVFVAAAIVPPRRVCSLFGFAKALVDMRGRNCVHALLSRAVLFSKLMVLLGLSSLALGQALETTQHGESSRVEDIRVEGLQRVSAESVFAALPILIGDHIDSDQAANAARALFATGNFQDIQIGINNGLLIITLQERPSISEINIEGNKAIETDALLDGLREQGMSEGRVFQRATLEGMRRELSRQYGSQGRYDADITTDVVAKPRNRVAIDIFVDEGSVAKIKQINMVGNEVYSDEKLRDLMELKDRGFMTLFNGKKKYAREKLSGDLENINDFYLDRGYIQFNLRSAQVSVGPKKKSVYITINVDEGEKFTVGEIKLAGEVKDQAAILERSYLLRSGQTFSQALVTRTEEFMKRIMGNQGYTFAEINAVPELNKEDKTVDITFFVEPKKRTYVRRVEFSGNAKTQDEVLRREMRQMEGALASTELIELSRVRLQRLGFFKGAQVETVEVAGSDDLIDVKFDVEEQSAGSVSASVGYSQNVGAIFSADFQQSNFLGTGKQVGIQANRSRFRTSYGLSYINPYYTENGVSRGFSLFVRETDFDEIGVASFSTNSYGGSVIFGYPINETQSLRFSLGYTKTEVETGFFAVQEILRTPLASGSSLEFARAVQLDDEGNAPVGILDELDLITLSESSLPQELGFIDKNGDEFGVFSINASWRESTLNRGILPTRGHANSLQLELAIPGSELEYYQVTYDSQYYLPVSRRFTLRLRGELGYGDGYGGTDELPFFEHFRAGGFGSVRGYEANTLGPRSTPAAAFTQFPVQIAADAFLLAYGIDGEGNLARGSPTDPTPDPFGGNLLVEGSVELIFPLPFLEDQRSVRSVLFYDFGNVFSDNCRSTQVELGCTDFDLSELRSSAGLAITWLSGFGPLSFSFGLPLEHDEDVDEREFFQFSLGRSF